MEFRESLGIDGQWIGEFRNCVGSEQRNSGIVFEVINGIAGIRWDWFRNVQHRGIGCILIMKEYYFILIYLLTLVIAVVAIVAVFIVLPVVAVMINMRFRVEKVKKSSIQKASRNLSYLLKWVDKASLSTSRY